MGEHRELVLRASRWLRGTMACGVVLCECSGDGIEQPDAIGWKQGGRHSILVEVKTSRSDFFRDAKKWHRRAGIRLGQERWYFTLFGLVHPHEVPEGWGLAELHNTDRVSKRVKPPKLERYDFEITRREHSLLFSAMRKVTLGIAPDTYGDWPVLVRSSPSQGEER